ncbi:MAG: energy-coupling factor ABC transporter ATP-binding protein [Candidatus Hermodarchaeia archaeon]|jgi:energy-coupling factor transport system ATP-binding protein
MGENGAGKTTLVKQINGLLKPTTGTVYVDGIDTRETSTAQLAKKIGFVFQNADHQLFADTLQAEVAFALRNLDFSKDEIDDRVARYLELFELTRYQDQSPFLLSGGERKRLALASVLCVEPQILILDEPTQAQDALQKEKLLTFMDTFRDPEHILLLVTHDVEFAVKAVDRLLVLSQGQLIADGSPTHILSNPRILDRARLLPPQLTQLAHQLVKEFPHFPTDVTTIAEAAEAVNQLLRRQR